jgi:hypothetical protein
MADLPALVVAVAALSTVHLTIGRLTFLRMIPRSQWLSLAGGVSVAYVFVRLLPDLARGQAIVNEAVPPALRFFEEHVYLLALAGLVAFYGLERIVRVSQDRPGGRYGESTTRAGIYWLHTGMFALYNLLIGYLLVDRGERGAASLAPFVFAMGFHFLAMDFGLKETHRGEYYRSGRWVLVAALAAGSLVAVATPVAEVWIALFTAALAGAVVLNVLKEELPAERKSRLLPFFAGAAAYAVVLLAI